MKDFVESSVRFDDLECFLLIGNPHKSGFKTFEIPEFETYKNGAFVALSNVGCINPLEGMFLGTNITQAGVTSGPCVIGFESFTDVTGVGRCCKIEPTQAGFTIAADPFGQERIFWGNIDGVSFVSNHLLLIAEFFKANGRKLSINKGAAYLQSFADSSIAMHSSVRKTVFDGISYLLPDQIIHLGLSGGIDVESIDRNTDPIGVEEYNAALDTCAELMTGKLAAAAKRFDTPVVRLTAGLDSRCTFALALATFGADNLKRLTLPVAPIDSFGSHLLGETYGVAAVDQFQDIDLAYENIVPALYRDLVANFGINHDIDGPKLGDFLHDSLLVGGGGGEIHRYAFEKRFRKVPGVSDPFSKDVARALFNFQYSGAFSQGSVSQMEEQLVDEIALLPGQTLVEKMESHYLSHKNRFHFSGTPRGFDAIARYNLMPLLDVDLWKVSQRVSRDQLESGAVLKDLAEKLVPGLAGIPYNEDLAKQYDIETKFKRSGPVGSDYDMRFPAGAVAATKKANAVFDDALYTLAELAVQRLRETGMFADIVDHGARRLTWMKTLPGHNFRRAWCSRLINLAKMTEYA